MEIKTTVNVSGVDPIEIKVDVPVEIEEKVEKKTDRELGEDAKWFDDRSLGFSPNRPEVNKIFLIQQQNYCNEKLKRNGFLTLNEVYDCLGICRTRRGQVVGWIWNPNDPDEQDVIDFGIFEDRNRDFVNGLTDKVLLDFNVRGDILKYL